MSDDDGKHESKRSLTDASLRAERDLVDQAFSDEILAVDDAADKVISKARYRADRVLAAARAKTDRSTRAVGGAPPEIIRRQRVQEDAAVREERADADEALRVERGAHSELLSDERSETDRDLLNERTHADEALATRDDFLGIVSHDLRNMLNTIVGYAGLIAAEVTRDDHVPRVVLHAERIQRSSARMSRLVGDLVDVASIEAGALTVTCTPSDPAQVVTEAVEIFQAHAAAHGVALSAEVPADALLASFDSARILQVLINLVSNAIKFTPPNGAVIVRVEAAEGALLFSVRDTGQGIPEDKAEVIFDRFHQLNKSDKRGVGLGLYISRCILEGHGGKIWAHSALGEGSTFSFTLPA